MEKIGNASTPTTLVALAVPSDLVITEPTNNVVILVQIVKSKREMGCDPFLGDQEVKIVGKWIRKIEKTLI
jgi:hypothetical protein